MAMKFVRILFVYKFCTLGGVERIILNRAKLYESLNIPIKICVSFLHENKAYIDAFQDYINGEFLNKRIEIFRYRKAAEKDFDFVIPIDTPEVFNDLKKDIIVECHSTYTESTRYLNNITPQVKKILVPSRPFKQNLLKKYNFSPDRVEVLQNFVLEPNPPKVVVNKIWNKNIIFYFGRLDEHKNISALMKIFTRCKEIEKNILFLIVSPNIYEYSCFLLKYSNLLDSLVMKEGVGFTESTDFLYLMRQHHGVYVSASNNESFGLATAEALSVGIPSVVRDIPPHRYLCQGYEPFLYSDENDVSEAAEKIIFLSKNYDASFPKNISNFIIQDMRNEHTSQVREIFNL